MKFFYLMLALFLSSCYVNMGTDISVKYRLARRAAIHAWTKVYGDVSPVCIWQAKRAEEHERSEKGLKKFCNSDKAGCVRTYDQFSAQFMDAQIYILKDLLPEQKLVTAVHEYIHVLGNCQSFDQDKNHDRKKWWMVNSGMKSIEAIGMIRVIELYEKDEELDDYEQDAGVLDELGLELKD